MSMKWRARSVWLGTLAMAAAVLVASYFNPSLGRTWQLPRYAFLAFGLGLAAAYYVTFFLAFRCPHCHAHQLRFTWDWLLMDDRCWRCHQALDGPARPRELVEEEFIGELDPVLAAHMRDDRLGLEDLRRRALTDPAAALELAEVLAARVEKLRAWAAIVRRQAPSDTHADQDLSRAEAELSDLRRLAHGGEPGP
jgi:hypothetical protein